MTPKTSSSDEEPTNKYLALRAAKIARNEERLRELGLLKPSARTASTFKSRSRPSAIPRSPGAIVEKAKPTRRSSRRCTRPDYFEEPSRKRRLDVSSEDMVASSSVNELIVSTKRKTTPRSVQALVPKENSVRRISISVHDISEKFLGRTMEHTGKAFVIQSTLGPSWENVSFNKYSGVQEWANDAIYLWVNIGKKDDDVVNEFLEQGRKITWFGGARMHDESPVIQKLLRVGQKQTNTTEQSTHEKHDGIILWCRQYNPTAKTYHPYTCLGRLAYHSHVEGSRPIKFCWNLLDFERLVSHEDDNIPGRFHELTHKL